MLADTSDRSISSVLRDIVGNVQDIVRSELRLAKIEFGEEITKAKAAGILLGLSAAAGFIAVFFALIAALFGLTLVMPNWAAALVIAVVLGVVALVMLSSGRKLLRKVHPLPKHTVDTVKENFQWAKQHTK